MLSKLIKHEMKSMWHYCGVVIICVLIASAVFELGLCGTILVNSDVVTMVMAPTLIFLGFTIIAVMSYGIKFGVAYRFYRTMASDEGYLTHTLPVTTSGHVFSKLLVAFIYTFLSLIFIALFIIITVLLAILLGGQLGEISGMLKELRFVYDELQRMINIPIAIYIVEYVILGIVGEIFSILIIYLAIALGQLMKTHKLIWAIVYYMIVTTAIGLVTQIISIIVSSGIGFLAGDLVNEMNPQQFVTVTQSVALISVVMLSLVSVGGYFLVKYIFERKLNLE